LPTLQALPQPPQFLLSREVSTQAPEHRLRPALHNTLQPLPVQVGVPLATVGQIFPQAPQLRMSFVLSTHTLPQRMVGRLHWKLQLPVHTGIALAGAVQVVPHFPQLDVSLSRLTQEVPHCVFVPQSVVHTPVRQT
jgi:hypothetical protein